MIYCVQIATEKDIIKKICRPTWIRTRNISLEVRGYIPLPMGPFCSTNIRNNFQSSKYFLRRLRDSNPGTCYSQQFSRLPHSTALPNLRCEIIINKLLFVNTVKCVQEKLAMIFSTNLWTNIINRARTHF